MRKLQFHVGWELEPGEKPSVLMGRKLGEAITAAIRGKEIDSPTVEAVRRELAPFVQKLNDVAPQVAADRNKAQLVWIQKVDGCSEIEKKAALLRTEGLSLSKIAMRLPHKNGKPMTRQGVKQVLLRFEKKTGNRGLFSRGTYRQNVRIESEANKPDEDGKNMMDS